MSSKTKSIKWDLCEVKFTQKCSLRRHTKTHDKKTQFKCEPCGKDFNLKSNLTRYINSIHNDKVLKHACQQCEKTFQNNANLKRHVKCVHEHSESFPCDICKNIFFDINYLSKHIETIHEKSSSTKCEICGKTFTDQRHLKLHISALHLKNKKIDCEVCNKTFYSKMSWCYAPIQPWNYTCNICHEVFSAFSMMQNYVTMTHLEQIIECNICETKYQTKHHLKLHMDQVHENIRSFKCEICGNRFVSNYQLTRHEILMHKWTAQRSTRQWSICFFFHYLSDEFQVIQDLVLTKKMKSIFSFWGLWANKDGNHLLLCATQYFACGLKIAILLIFNYSLQFGQMCVSNEYHCPSKNCHESRV